MSQPDAESAVAALFDRVGTAKDRLFPLIRLTDEELCALDGGPGNPSGTPYPWLDGHEDGQRTFGCQAAIRVLAVRGLITMDEQKGAEPHAAKSLRAALHVRSTADTTVMAERRSATDKRFRLLYIHAACALEDDVTSDGVHSLSIASRELALARLTRFADPDRNAQPSPDTERRFLPYDRIATGMTSGELSIAQYVTAIHLTSEAGDKRITVYTLINKVLVTEPAMAARSSPGVCIEEVSPARLATRIRDFAAG